MYYEVDRIVKARGSGNRVQYLVRWKGYGEDADSWVAARHIGDQQLIDDFEAGMAVAVPPLGAMLESLQLAGTYEPASPASPSSPPIAALRPPPASGGRRRRQPPPPVTFTAEQLAQGRAVRELA